jgi:hypothetical protein
MQEEEEEHTLAKQKSNTNARVGHNSLLHWPPAWPWCSHLSSPRPAAAIGVRVLAAQRAPRGGANESVELRQSGITPTQQICDALKTKTRF